MQSATTLEVYILVITQLVVNTLTMVNGSLSMMPGRLSYLLKNQKYLGSAEKRSKSQTN